MAILQDQFYADVHGCNVLRSFHQPDSGKKTDIGLLVCPAMYEEKQESQRAVLNFSNLVAEKGISVLRFDYRGQAESEGDLHEFHPADLIDDIKLAYDDLKLRPGINKIGILGVRYGCNLMAKAAKDLNPEFLLGWSPIIDSANYVKTILWTNLTNQMMVHRKIVKDRKILLKELQEGIPVDVDGYKLTLDWYDYLIGDNLAESLLQLDNKGLFLDVCADPEKPNKAWTRFLETLGEKAPNWNPKRVKGDTFWRLITLYAERPREVFESTLAYLEENYLGSD